MPKQKQTLDTLFIRLSPALKARVMEKAAKLGLSTAAYIRLVLNTTEPAEEIIQRKRYEHDHD